MSNFTKSLKINMSDDGKFFTLLEDLTYYRKNDTSDLIRVSAGFVSDGFTNFGFHFLVNQYGRGLKCAILHDYLCSCFHNGAISRKEADSIFLESMLETRAFSKVRCYVIYFFVRIFAKIKGYK